jgi:transcriptional antiterminator NusG
MNFAIGDRVRVAAGRFVDFVGVVNQIDLQKSKVKVMVSLFGRETPLELDFPQVEKL